MVQQIHYRACPLCEAICGLEITVEDGEITTIRGDRKDPFSRGHVCPKAVALKDLHTDPDRLRRPQRRVGAHWREISWSEAFDLVSERLLDIRARHGAEAVGVYLGNPGVHNLGIMTHSRLFLQHIKSRNKFSATSVDQLPHQLVAYWMYGHQLLVPVPDLDRTRFFLILCGNPLVSNGSMMTAPDMRRRLGAIIDRGGRLVVLDPRRTETAELATDHHPIRPETDAAFLLAFLHTLFEEGLVRPTPVLDLADGLDEVRAAVRPFSPQRAERVTGLAARDIRRLARDFAAAEGAVCYGRMGTSTQSFGTLCQWLIQWINLVTGNLDRPGGALFTTPAVDLVASANPGSFNRWRSRVRNLPEFSGFLPSSTLADEILTPGDGRIRALVTIAGNPVLSVPNGKRLGEALERLDFMVSIDPYRNETTHHADLILPPCSPLEKEHYDMIFNGFAVRNVTRYSQPVFADKEGLDEWEIFTGLDAALAARQGKEPAAPYAPGDVIDLGLQGGPYGAASGHEPALSLDVVKAAPHGIDLGPLQPSLPGRLKTPDHRIHGAVPDLLDDLERAERDLFSAAPATGLTLIGRRDVRTNNSWMHNALRLVKGPERCVLWMNPDDMARRQMTEGDLVILRSRVGAVRVRVAASAAMMPGVVSLPHGWGHEGRGVKLSVAGDHAGVSINDVTDNARIDPVSGNAALSGTPVEVTAAGKT